MKNIRRGAATVALTSALMASSAGMGAAKAQDGQMRAQTAMDLCGEPPPHRADDAAWLETQAERCRLIERIRRLTESAREAQQSGDMEKGHAIVREVEEVLKQCGEPCIVTAEMSSTVRTHAMMRTLSPSGLGAQVGMVALPDVAGAIMGSGGAGGRFPQAQASGTRRVEPGSSDQIALDTDTGSWPLVRQRMRSARAIPPEAVRPEEWVHWFEQDASQHSGGADDIELKAQTLQSPWNPETRLVRIGLHARYAAPTPGPQLAVTWLVDRSGSMSNVDRFALVTEVMARHARRAQAGTMLSIAAYAAGVETILEPTTDRAEIERAVKTLREQGTGGGTAGAAGLERAIALAGQTGKDRRKIIVIATDGDFNIGPSGTDDVEAIAERCRREGIEVHVMLVGQSNVRDDIGQALAQAGNGRGYYADTVQEGLRMVSEQLARPAVARDAKIRFEPNPAVLAEFRRIGLDTRELTEEAFGAPDTDGGELAAGNAASVWYEVVERASPHRYLPEQRYGPARAATGEAERNEWATVTVRYRSDGKDKEAIVLVDGEDEADPQTEWLAAVLWAAEKMRGTGPARASAAGEIYAYARSADERLGGTERRRGRLELLDLLFWESERE